MNRLGTSTIGNFSSSCLLEREDRDGNYIPKDGNQYFNNTPLTDILKYMKKLLFL